MLVISVRDSTPFFLIIEISMYSHVLLSDGGDTLRRKVSLGALQ